MRKTNKKVNIFLAYSDGEKRDGKAIEIKIKGFSKLRYFYTLDEGGFCLDDYRHRITEFSTGLLVANGKTKEECFELLKKRLKNFSSEWIISQGKKILSKNKLKYPLNKFKKQKQNEQN